MHADAEVPVFTSMDPAYSAKWFLCELVRKCPDFDDTHLVITLCLEDTSKEWALNKHFGRTCLSEIFASSSCGHLLTCQSEAHRKHQPPRDRQGHCRSDASGPPRASAAPSAPERKQRQQHIPRNAAIHRSKSCIRKRSPPTDAAKNSEP